MTTFECTNNNYYGDQPALMAKLVVNYTDGSSDTVVTDDGSWTYYNDGPVRLASLFQGERYDATKEAGQRLDTTIPHGQLLLRSRPESSSQIISWYPAMMSRFM